MMHQDGSLGDECWGQCCADSIAWELSGTWLRQKQLVPPTHLNLNYFLIIVDQLEMRFALNVRLSLLKKNTHQ